MSAKLCSAGHVVPPDAPEELCPECLLLLSSQHFPTRVGEFRIVKELGQGGFGRVFLARRGKEEVALKIIRDGAFADRGACRRFRDEFLILSQLSHHGIVAIGELGEHDGTPFFTMEYMPGGTLRQKMDEAPFTPEQAAALVIQIARIVEFLHRDPQRPERAPVLHRDLKPENILFDCEGNPRVADFGIAKLANEQQVWSQPTSRVGCPQYMAPEQAAANGELTAAVDVYSLGVILYELFTGRPPFEGSSLEVFHQLKFVEPIAPRRLVKDLDRFLETVVLNALEKEPARRYRTVHAFAEDLERALSKKLPEYRPLIPVHAKLWHWIRRNPLATALLVWAAVLAVVVSAGASSTLVERERELDEQQEDTAVMASSQAVAMKLQLREYAQRIAGLSQDPQVKALLTAPTIEAPSKTLLERVQGFDTMFVTAPDGRPRARTSWKTDEYLQRPFSFRDYFRGARRLALTACDPASALPSPRSPSDTTHDASAAYVARAYISESDGQFEFAVSAPICDARGWVGVLVGTVGADAALGSVRLVDARRRYITALLGPRDNDRRNGAGPLPHGFTFVAHPALRHGQFFELTQPQPAVIRQALGIPADTTNLRFTTPLRIDDYDDPLLPDRHWAASFASVNESGYVVVVQAARSDKSVGQQLFDSLALPAGIPFGSALLLLAFLKLAHLENQRRRSSTQRRNANRAWARAPAARSV